MARYIIFTFILIFFNQGRFSNGLKNGKGIHVVDDNSIFKQTWDAGVPVSSEALSQESDSDSLDDIQDKGYFTTTKKTLLLSLKYIYIFFYKNNILDEECPEPEVENFESKIDIHVDCVKFEKAYNANEHKALSSERSPLSLIKSESAFDARSNAWDALDMGSETISLIENLDMFTSLDDTLIFKKGSKFKKYG